MPFSPNPGDEFIIHNITYRVAEHPAAPGIAYGQEGRAGTVYRLLAPSGGPDQALKVFKPRFRLPFLVAQAERITPFAALPGLAACRRTVLTPFRQPDLLRQYPDLTYAVLMPWIEGPTWQEVLLDKKLLSPEQSLALARGLAEVLARMEEQGIAHCDLSAPNVMLPALTLTPRPGGHPPLPLPLAGEGEGGRGERVRAPIELVDLEGLYAPGMLRPQELSSGSMGYAHHQAAGGLWGPDADRFAGAVLLAEMLGFCDPQVVEAAWGETYFDPQEMQQDSPRYRTLLEALRRTWGEGVAALFERAWRSDTLADCPTFGEWLIALPERPPAAVGAGLAPAPEGQPQGLPLQTDLLRAQVQALMGVARQLEETGNLEGALVNYRQAQALAAGDPVLAGLAREIGLVVADLEGQGQKPVQAIPVPPQARRTAPPVAVAERPERALAEGRPRRRGRGWLWAVVALLVIAGLIGWGLWQQQVQQEQTASLQATSHALAQANAATAQAAQATDTAQDQATVQTRATTIAQAQATATAQAQVIATAQAIALPVLPGTPMPRPVEPISTANADRIVQLARFGEGTISGVAWSPGGRLLAAVPYLGVHLYDAENLQEIRFIETEAPVDGISFSPDGQILALGLRDNTVQLWQLVDSIPSLMVIKREHTDDVVSVSFSPDGQTLASGSLDRTIKLWRIPDGDLIRTLESHTAQVLSIAFSLDGQTLASGSMDQTVKLWQMPDGRLIRTLEGHSDWVSSVAFSPDGRILASGSKDSTVRLWRVADGQPLRTLEGYTDSVLSVAFSPDGQTLASGAWDNTVRLWRVSDGTLLRTLEGHTGPVWSVAFSPDGQILASGSWDGTVRLWGVR